MTVDVEVRADGAVVAYHGGRCYGIAPVAGTLWDWVVYHPQAGGVRVTGGLAGAVAWVEAEGERRRRVTR